MDKLSLKSGFVNSQVTLWMCYIGRQLIYPEDIFHWFFKLYVFCVSLYENDILKNESQMVAIAG